MLSVYDITVCGPDCACLYPVTPEVLAQIHADYHTSPHAILMNAIETTGDWRPAFAKVAGYFIDAIAAEDGRAAEAFDIADSPEYLTMRVEHPERDLEEVLRRIAAVWLTIVNAAVADFHAGKADEDSVVDGVLVADAAVTSEMFRMREAAE